MASPIGLGTFVPTVAEIKKALLISSGNIVACYKELIADLETPVSTFLKIRQGDYSFLLESVEGGERLARYSFVGSSPYELLRVGGDDCPLHGDPLIHLESALKVHTLLPVPSVKLPPFTGGAIGYVAYDAVAHFEPRTAPFISRQEDALGLPESIFMLCDALVVFDHVRHTIKVVAHCRLPIPAAAGAAASADDADAALATAYGDACRRIDALCARLGDPLPTEYTQRGGAAVVPTLPPTPLRSAADAGREGAVSVPELPLPPAVNGAGGKAPAVAASSSVSSPTEDFDWEAGSNVGRAGYESMVTSLQTHITAGDIIQAVPSQRISRPLPDGVQAFDVYRHLRVVNPSPYMFYLELGPDFQIVGASPEMLVKVEPGGALFTHPIAGTRRRGATPEEDERLAAELLGDAKERAEHVMLVDLGRNDIGRVSAPGTVRVDSLMHIERYSHVMHIVSNLSGKLAPGKTAYDAFRAVFPAGTVSGAPKVKAIELVASLEHQKRHVYAGAVGYVGYSGVMDTAISIRTLVVRGRQVHLQAGAGIVYDSVPRYEYDETISKLKATMRAVDAAVYAAGKGGKRSGGSSSSSCVGSASDGTTSPSK